MTVTRPTSSEAVRTALSDLQTAYARLQRTQEQLSTGRQINRPEDDPFGAGRALSLRDRLGDVGQLQRNIDDAKGFLQQGDVALGNVTSLLQRARELVVQGANTTLDQSQLDAIAEEIHQLREAAREQMNAQFAGKYLFGGSATLTQPYDATGTYNGNDDVVKRLIGEGGITVDLNVRGWEAFSTPPAAGSTENVLTSLDRIESELRAGNRTAISGEIDAVQAHIDQVSEARAKIGSRTNRLDTTAAQLSDTELNVKDLLSKTEDVDIAKAMVDYSSQQATYESALRTSARILQPTLMDFLG